MRTIPLVLTGLLLTSFIPLCAAGNTEQSSTLTQDKSKASSSPKVSAASDETAITSRNAKSTTGNDSSADHLVQAIPAVQNVAEVKAPPASPAPATLPAANEVKAEGTEKDPVGN